MLKTLWTKLQSLPILGHIKMNSNQSKYAPEWVGHCSLLHHLFRIQFYPKKCPRMRVVVHVLHTFLERVLNWLFKIDSNQSNYALEWVGCVCRLWHQLWVIISSLEVYNSSYTTLNVSFYSRFLTWFIPFVLYPSQRWWIPSVFCLLCFFSIEICPRMSEVLQFAPPTFPHSLLSKNNARIEPSKSTQINQNMLKNALGVAVLSTSFSEFKIILNLGVKMYYPSHSRAVFGKNWMLKTL